MQHEIAEFDLSEAYAILVSEDEPPRNDPVSVAAWDRYRADLAEALLSEN